MLKGKANIPYNLHFFKQPIGVINSKGNEEEMSYFLSIKAGRNHLNKFITPLSGLSGEEDPLLGPESMSGI